LLSACRVPSEGLRDDSVLFGDVTAAKSASYNVRCTESFINAAVDELSRLPITR
jgi:hypothetical protein